MRKLVLFLLLCAAMVGVRAQMTYRYWLDNNLSTLQTVNGTGEVQFNLDVSGLAREKVHALHVQAVNGEGVLSSPMTHFFYLPAVTSVSTTARYWFDNDESTQQTTNTVNGAIDLDVTGLSAGFHMVHYQTFGQDGKPSSVVTSRFYIEDTNNERLTCSLWFDDDEAHAVTETVNADGINLDVSALSPGTHEIHVALFDEYGVYVGTEVAEFEVPIPTKTITLNSLGKGTYCSESPLNFTNVSGIYAYIVSGFKPSAGNLIVTRVYEVPAGTGLYIVGTPGSTYNIPIESTDFYYSNMMKGVTVATVIPANEDGYTNYVLSGDGHGGVIFKLSNNASSPANRAYVQIPTSTVGAREFLGIEIDDDSTAGLNGVFTFDTKEAEGDYYNLSGQKVQTPQRGLYIKNRKKIIIH